MRSMRWSKERARGVGPAGTRGALLLLLTAACGPPPADLVVRGGRIATVDTANPLVEALAVAGDTIVAVGSDDEIAAHVGGETRVIELEGHLAVPGFVESHGHFMGLGRSRMQLDLMAASTWEEIVALVDSAAEASEPGSWILGRGWHQEKWSDRPARVVMGFPTHDRLSAVAPDHPVFLTHASGHATLANRKAMELAGVDRSTRSPAGGEIVRDGRGRATGVFLDNASGLVGAALRRARADMTPAQIEAERRRIVELAQEEALRHGVTSFHDQGASYETIDFYRTLAEEGALRLRLYAMVSEDAVDPEHPEDLASRRAIDHGAQGRLTVRSIGEISSDGALGSHSAWLLEPYADRPGYEGLAVTSMERIRELARVGLETGYQLAVHAIGDRANRETLDLFASVWDSAGVEDDTLRWRIEHAQHLHPDDIPRFAELGVIASMQGIHACSDAPYVVQRLGEERARTGAYLWKTLWETGALVTNGTDVPVEAIDPFASFHCTVTREIVGAPDDSTFFPEEALARGRALRSYTLNGAVAAFQEEAIGSLAPGKKADIVVLSRDILTVPEDSIRGTEVLYTLVDGEVVYSNPGR